jgi:hypothetical protein
VHRAHSRGGKLDGEGKPVEIATQLCDDLGVVGGESTVRTQTRIDRTGAFREEGNGIVEAERSKREDSFTRERQRFPARGEDPKGRTRAQEISRECRSALNEVLAVVE